MNLLLDLLASVVALVTLYRVIVFLLSKCCFTQAKPLTNIVIQPPLGDDFLSVVGNPKAIWRYAALKYVEVLGELTGVTLVSRGMMYSVGPATRAKILFKLMVRLGVRKGVGAYLTFLKVLRGCSDKEKVFDECVEFRKWSEEIRKCLMKLRS